MYNVGHVKCKHSGSPIMWCQIGLHLHNLTWCQTLTQIDSFHERTTLMDLWFYSQSCTRQADVYTRCDLLTKQQDWSCKNLVQKKHTWKQFDTSRSTQHASCLSRETPHLPFPKSKVQRRTRRRMSRRSKDAPQLNKCKYATSGGFLWASLSRQVVCITKLLTWR